MRTKADKLAATIVTYLKSAGELESLRGVVDALMRSTEYKKSVNQVVVTSASKLEGAALKQIESFIAKKVGHDYMLTTLVNEDLVAGFTLQINDTLIDASFLGKIMTIEDSLQTKE